METYRKLREDNLNDFILKAKIMAEINQIKETNK